MKVLIHGSAWDFQVVDEDSFSKRFGEDAAALTFPDSKKVYFDEEQLTRAVVIHELVHAYYSSLCTNSASLEPIQVEEVFCELFAEHGNKILRHARIIYKELKE